MTATELAERRAHVLAELNAGRPVAAEPDVVPIFKPGAIIFRDSQYGAVSPSIEAVWPVAERWLSCLLDMLPQRHRMEHLRACLDRGAVLLTVFGTMDGEAWRTYGAGIISHELSDDGEPYVFVPVLTFREDLDLTHLSRIAEATALLCGARSVKLWTPQAAPIVAGYGLEKCWFGQMQTAPVRPIQ